MDGNIECFTGWHTGLAVLAMCTLVFCMLLIPVIFIYAQGYLEVRRGVGWGGVGRVAVRGSGKAGKGADGGKQ